MQVLFDEGVPAPLRSAFVGIATVETAFDVFITTDKNSRYQQNLAPRNIAIVVLPTTQWPALRARADEIARITADAASGAFTEIPGVPPAL